MIKKYWLLFLILILAAVLRLWNLATVPPGLTWDEVGHGYNAYSLIQTGKDEYGNFLPLNLKSFGDWKPALLTYLLIPSVAILGLSELAVRLPNALTGVGLVLLVYLFVYEVSKNRWVSLASCLMMAISPLGIIFSRAAFESHLALFLNLLATLLFIKGIKGGKKLLISSGIFFGLSLLTYQASRIFVPLLVLGLLIIYRRDIKFNLYSKAFFLIFALFFLITFYLIFILGQGQRLQAMNFFSYQRPTEQLIQISSEDNLNREGLQFQILHGEWFSYLKGLGERYLIYFSPRMIFIDGDYSPRHSVPDLGIFYYLSAIFIPLGIIYFIKNNSKETMVLFYFLAIGTIPAVLSRDLIAMLRAFNYVLPMTILEGAGLYYILQKLHLLPKIIFYLSVAALSILLFINFSIFVDRYFIHMPKEQSQGWVYGYKQVFESIRNLDLSKYNRIIITDFYGQPYMYYLFNTKYPPLKFQHQAVLDQPTVDVGTVRKIDNIFFKHIYWPGDRGEKNSLFIGSLEELPDKDTKPFKEYKILKDVYFLDGQHAFRVVESK